MALKDGFRQFYKAYRLPTMYFQVEYWYTYGKNKKGFYDKLFYDK
jgi:hypothetical protein